MHTKRKHTPFSKVFWSPLDKPKYSNAFSPFSAVVTVVYPTKSPFKKNRITKILTKKKHQKHVCK